MTVVQPGLFKIEEETADRLILQAKKSVYILGGAFLIVMGGIFAFASTAVKNKGSAGAIALLLIGLLILVGGVALIRVAITQKNRVIFDRATRVVNFDLWPRRLQAIVPYDSIEAVDMEILEKVRQNADRRDEKYVVYQVNIVEKSGNKRSIDNSTNVDKMLELANKVAQACGVPFKGTTA